MTQALASRSSTVVEGGSVDDRTARVEVWPLVLGSQQRGVSEPPERGSWAGRPLDCEQMSRIFSGRRRSSIPEPIPDTFRFGSRPWGWVLSPGQEDLWRVVLSFAGMKERTHRGANH